MAELLGLPLAGDVPSDAIPVAAVAVVELLDDTAPNGRTLHVLASDMTTWAQAGMLLAATDTIRQTLRDDWEPGR